MTDHSRHASEVRAHYNEITDGWALIFGECFHLGYFAAPTDTLDQATANLVDLMANLGSFTEQTTVLDVGCGIGGPAFHLHEKYHCDVTGITISDRGVELAQSSPRCARAAGKVRFLVADVLGGFAPETQFDLIWIMEVSHLIPDKPRLFARCHELLKDGGELLLCDMISVKEFSAFDVLRHGRQLATLERTFGKAKTETLAYYRQVLTGAGFAAVKTRDISKRIFPTMEHWRENIRRHRAELARCMSPQQLQDYLESCDILEDFYRRRRLGYGLVKGVKTASA